MNKFSFYKAPATMVNYYSEADLRDVYRCITNPKVAGIQTQTLRALTDDKLRAEYKRKAFHYCTFSGSFGPERRNNSLIQHSGLMCHDFDHLEDVPATRKLLLQDPHFKTRLLFVSPSGHGLKWVIDVDLQQADHLTWFTAVSNYLKTTYGLLSDPACKNVARACFIPFDPECYIDPSLLPELSDMPQVVNFATRFGATNIQITDIQNTEENGNV